MLQKNNRILNLLFIALVVLLSGCNSNGKSDTNHYFLSLMGESQTWRLSGYEVMITPENFKTGNGTLYMKNKNEYITDSFHFETHAVINGEDLAVHTGSVSGKVDLAKKTTGAIEGGTYLNEKGNPISLNEVSDIYVIVEWKDSSKSKNVKERIDLYTKSNNEKTFLY